MRKGISMIFLVASLSATLAQAGGGQTDPGKEADIRHLLDLTGSSKIQLGVMERMTEQVKDMLVKSLPAGEHSQEIVNAFTSKMMARARANPNELLDLMVPIYDKHLTREDIKGLIQFYESPLGRRLAEVMPDIAQEGYAAGAQWGRKIAQDVLQEMRKEYPELEKP